MVGDWSCGKCEAFRGPNRPPWFNFHFQFKVENIVNSSFLKSKHSVPAESSFWKFLLSGTITLWLFEKSVLQTVWLSLWNVAEAELGTFYCRGWHSRHQNNINKWESCWEITLQKIGFLLYVFYFDLREHSHTWVA